MTAALVVLFAAAMASLAPSLGIGALLVMAALLAAMMSSGRVVCKAFGAGEDPFLALVVGFLLLSHALLAADLVVPGAHWQIAAAVAVVGLPGWRTAGELQSRPAAGLGLLIACFTFVWCADIQPRLIHFRATGEFDFWLDQLLHAGTLAQFGSQETIGRGMSLMADMPRQLYHFASYLPAALLPRLAGVPLLDATLLFWIPLGVLVMACGIVALGLELGGPALAAAALMAVALVPDPARLSLGNGFLGFAWLLETGPGAPYSLGVACAALASLVRWSRDRRLATLALSIALTAGCFLIRANTFLWLAPLIVLGIVVGWPRVDARLRSAAVAVGFVGLVAIYALISWQPLWSSPAQFLFGYVESVHQLQEPTYVSGLYQELTKSLGRSGAGIVGTGLTLLGTMGPWLPALFVSAALARRRGRLEAVDALPFILLAVATIAILMAPSPRHGDISEFRHRAGPLLVVVPLVWSLRFAAIAAAPELQRWSVRSRRIALIGSAVLSIGALGLTIGPLKQPRMAWGAKFFGIRVAHDLAALAPLLQGEAEGKASFAMAGQPSDSFYIDDAASLVALSGVPAYISCPGYLLTLKGPIADEARRRLAVLRRIADAPTLEALQGEMRAEGIAYYVVTTPRDAPFDPERRGAIGRKGAFAIYAARAE
jgi:hypothetical protein